jgi:hypothetical protein
LFRFRVEVFAWADLRFGLPIDATRFWLAMANSFQLGPLIRCTNNITGGPDLGFQGVPNDTTIIGEGNVFGPGLVQYLGEDHGVNVGAFGGRNLRGDIGVGNSSGRVDDDWTIHD